VSGSKSLLLSRTQTGGGRIFKLASKFSENRGKSGLNYLTLTLRCRREKGGLTGVVDCWAIAAASVARILGFGSKKTSHGHFGPREMEKLSLGNGANYSYLNKKTYGGRVLVRQ